MAKKARAPRYCGIHVDEPLFETNPADVENGPQPNDAENEWICFECQSEMETAVFDSVCLPHRKPVNDCLWCAYEDLEKEEVQ